MAGATARPLTVTQLDAATDARWAAFVRRPTASLFHSPEWAAVLRDTYGFSVVAHVVDDTSGRIVAGVPVCRIEDPVGRRIISLPFSDHCTPLADAPGHWPMLRETLCAEAQPLSILTLGDADAAPDEQLTIAKRARWHGMELADGLDAVEARLAPTRRRAIRKAARAGVHVEPGDGERFLREFMRMHVAVRKHKYRLLAQPAGFFAAIARTFAASGGWLPLAAFHRGRCIAATIFLAWGDTLYYRFNTSEFDALPLRPNDLLLWEGIRLAVARGCRRLDLGRSDDDQPGLIRFKQQFGAAEREIRLLRFTPPEYRAESGAEPRRLLATMTTLFTDPAIPDDVSAAAGTALYRYFA